MDRKMMRALQMDAAMLDAMGAGEQPLAFEADAVGMRLTDARNDLWEVYDQQGNIVASDLPLHEAEKMLEMLAALLVWIADDDDWSDDD